MITPEDIERKEFTVKTFKGYDPEEVDGYLDQVVEDYRSLFNRLSLVLHDNERLRNTSDTMVIPPVIGDAVKLLNVAQAAHDETVREANDQAGRIVSDAEKNAKDIVSAGHEKRHAMIGQLEEQRQGLQEHVTALQKTVEAIRAQMCAALEATGEPA